MSTIFVALVLLLLASSAAVESNRNPKQGARRDKPSSSWSSSAKRIRRQEDDKASVVERLNALFQHKVTSLDPLQLSAVPLAWEKGGCFVKGLVNDTQATGLARANLSLTDFDMDTFALTVQAHVPELTATGTLALETMICGLGHLTSGRPAPFSLTLRDVSAEASANFTIRGHQMQAEHIDLSVNLTGVEASIKGLFADPRVDGLATDVLSTHGARVFNLVKPLLKEGVVGRLRARINEFLNSADLLNEASG